MNLLRLRAFTKTKVFLVIIMISSTCLGQDCNSYLSIIEDLSDASILQGQNHTFEAKGNGSFIDWELNGVPLYTWSQDSVLEVVDTQCLDSGVCIQESTITILAKGAPEDNTLSNFAVRYVIRDTSNPFVAVYSDAYLRLHVIGDAGDVQLIPPANPQGSAMIQWQAPNVLSGSSSPLYYNITVMSSTQVVAQATTMDTFFAIDNDQLVPCASYQLSILPFQDISSHIELGIMTQTSINYSGIPLPATGVDLTISMQPDLARVTIHFQAQLTSCSLQRPKKFTVTVNRQETDADETVLSVQQTVMGVMNEYTLEKKLDLRQKYRLSLILENDFSSSAPEIANFSTFDVQNLTLNIQGGGRQLNVTCEMAKGAEDKKCTVHMKNETGAMQHNCIPTSGTNTTCKLAGLPLGKYMVLGYDWDNEENVAVKREVLFTKELIEDPTNTLPTIRTDDATTVQSSPDGFEDEAALLTEIVVGILAALISVIVVAVVVSFLIIVVLRKKTRKTDLHGPEPPEREDHFYPTGKENPYDLGLPWEQDAIDEYTGESTVVQEPNYDVPQTVVIRTAALANNSSVQYMQHRNEWLVGPLHSDGSALPPSHSEATTSPHTHIADHAPQNINS